MEYPRTQLPRYILDKDDAKSAWRKHLPEADLQREVVMQLRAYLPDNVRWFASLSGVRLTPGVAGRAKAAGMNRGAPDLSFIWPSSDTTYIELKARGGRLTPEQVPIARTLGPKLAVCRTWDEVEAAVSVWLNFHGLRWLTERESLHRAKSWQHARA